MENGIGHHPDVAKYREGFLKPEKDFPSHSWERTYLAGSAMIDIPHSLTEDPKWRRDAWEQTQEGEKPETDPRERAAARLTRASIQSGLTEKEYLLACPGLFRFALDKNREIDTAAIGRIFLEFAGTASKMGFWPDEVLSGKLNSQERVALFGQVYGLVKGHQRIVNNKDPQLADMRERVQGTPQESVASLQRSIQLMRENRVKKAHKKGGLNAWAEMTEAEQQASEKRGGSHSHLSGYGRRGFLRNCVTYYSGYGLD